MNDHLIKNFRISMLLYFLWSIVAVGIFSYLIKETDWYTGFYYLIYPTYLVLKGKKILLEINLEKQKINIESYSILTGKKKLNISLNEVIQLDFYNGFVIKYKNADGKKTETFEINAEPWNNIYGQIKQLKLDFQEQEQKKAENLNLNITD